MQWLPAVRFIVVVALTLSLVSCDLDREYTLDFARVESGQVYIRVPDTRPALSLTQEQVLLLSQWLEAHRGGWHGLMITPPLSAFSFGFTCADGRKYSVDVFVGTHGDGAIYVYPV